MFDLNGDGFAEKEDLIKIFKADEEYLKNFIDTLFKQADADGDGKLSFQEFRVFSELFWSSK
ncbi:hypothetical protein FRC00_002523 [Tulasnella sp. 408]|nr:hypothetical protein FRC00_002523 [Tulasnella sp. 408]